MGKDTVNAYLTHKRVKELMVSGETFDICMFENFNAEAMMVINNYFKYFLAS
jgi:hypothetical protein